jgi:hypothetical protein
LSGCREKARLNKANEAELRSRHQAESQSEFISVTLEEVHATIDQKLLDLKNSLNETVKHTIIDFYATGTMNSTVGPDPIEETKPVQEPSNLSKNDPHKKDQSVPRIFPNLYSVIPSNSNVVINNIKKINLEEFKCTFCAKIFKRQQDLKTHITKIHAKTT